MAHLITSSQQKLYMVNHHLVDLGWFDFDLDVPPVLTTCSAHSAKIASAQQESGRVEKPKSVIPTQVREVMAHPVLPKRTVALYSQQQLRRFQQSSQEWTRLPVWGRVIDQNGPQKDVLLGCIQQLIFGASNVMSTPGNCRTRTKTTLS